MIGDPNAEPGAVGPVVLIVDDHQLVSTSLAIALSDRGLRGHHCATTGIGDILRVADGFPPGLVLLDLDLGTGAENTPIDEIELLAGFRARGWSTLVVSGAADERRIGAAIGAGAVGYVSKSAPLTDLLDIVCEAAAGRPVLTPTARARWLDIDGRWRAAERLDRARMHRLSAREREVLERIARGERAAEIAASSRVSLATVRTQVQAILTKLDVNSQLEAVALLRRIPGGRG